MSEILRAVMDDSCGFSQPCFYTIPFTDTSGASGVREQQTLVTNQDRFFLMTAMAVTWSEVTQGAVTEGCDVSIFDALTSERLIMSSPATVSPANMIGSFLLNGNLNTLFTMPEYKLWRPSSTIGAQLLSRIPDSLANFTVVLVGIEYGDWR